MALIPASFAWSNVVDGFLLNSAITAVISRTGGEVTRRACCNDRFALPQESPGSCHATKPNFSKHAIQLKQSFVMANACHQYIRGPQGNH
jgi:hypothetical protein